MSSDRGLRAAFKRDHWTYVEGYESAAAMLVDSLKATWKELPPLPPGFVRAEVPGPDQLVYPILLLCRHALELHLKGFNRAFGNSGTFGHDLWTLWNFFKASLTEIAAKDRWPEVDPASLNGAENLVLYFHKLDPKGDFFRYADAKPAIPHLPLELEGFVKERCGRVFGFFFRLVEDFTTGPPWTWGE